MAKKKVSHSQAEKASSKADDLVKEVPPQMSPEAFEKLENLKELNRMLIKEAVERRQQVDSLVKSKSLLEGELTRSNSEMEVLNSELTRLGETAAGMEIETNVVDVFVGVQLDVEGEVALRKMSELRRVIEEKESVIEKLTAKLRETEGVLENEMESSRKVGLERDQIKKKHDLLLEEGGRMRENLVKLEERERAVEQELGKLRDAYNDMIGENGNMKLRIESITKEKDLIQRSLTESNKLVEEMKEKHHEVLREKKVVEEEKKSEVVRRQELEKDVSNLNEMVFVLQKEEVKLKDVIAVLENKVSMGEERLKEMKWEIDRLSEENKVSEKKLKGLSADKTTVERDLRDKLEELVEEKRKSKAIVNENSALTETKGGLESEVRALQDQVVELNSIISKMKQSSLIEVSKIERLASEVGNYKLNLEQVKTERDKMKVYLDDEKLNAEKLKENIRILEGKIGDNLRAFEKVKADNSVLYSKKADLESQCEMLKKETVSLENAATKWRKKFDLMNARVQKSDAKSGVVLNMLKETAAFCSGDECGKAPSNWVANGKEMKAYAAEFEVIKSASRNKASEIGSMKRQLEVLQGSAEDAHRKKRFWAVWSSAMTLVAAVSIAYVVRGH